MRKLDIGPGLRRIDESWETLNLLPGPHIDHVARWGEEPLPFRDCVFDLVHASHVIEHIPWWATVQALEEARRILVVGGSIELHTVDFGKVVDAYVARRPVDQWRGAGLNPKLDPMLSVSSRIFAYGKTRADPNWHKAVFDAAHLERCMADAGFDEIKECAPRAGEHGSVNLGLRGVRR